MAVLNRYKLCLHKICIHSKQMIVNFHKSIKLNSIEKCFQSAFRFSKFDFGLFKRENRFCITDCCSFCIFMGLPWIRYVDMNDI